MTPLGSHLTRRNLLMAGGAVAAVAGTGALLRPRPLTAQERYAFEQPLAIPALDKGTLTDGVRVFDLSMQAGESEFFKGRKTATNGINGAYLAPVLRMRQGETVRFNVTNTFTYDTTLHWHGFNLPARADGGPHQIIKPGQTWSPEFPVLERASTMWYHSHLLNETAAQVWSGLAGMIVIDDDNADALDLPSTYGVDDIPVVLQDRRFYNNGAMPYEPGMRDRMAGMIGNVPLVNGTVMPHLAVTTGKVRLRLLNGSNASIYTLGFSDGRSFSQIASDGGLLKAPVTLTSLPLAPGERAEIVVDMTSGKRATLESKAAGGFGTLSRGMGMMAGAQTPTFKFMELRPEASLTPSPALPARLADIPAIDPAKAMRTRRLRLEMGGMGFRMMFGGGAFTINGKAMDRNRIDTVVKKGETEIWEIENASPMAHPFHIHNTQYRIIDRGGRPPAPGEAGRKDTVVVNPGEIVRILIRFDTYTDAKRPYMYHCHILEHEDGGMMGQFTVV